MAAHLSLLGLLRADFRQAARQAQLFHIGPLRARRWVGMALLPALLCVMVHRLAHATWRAGLRRVAVGISWINRAVFRACFDPAAEIGPGLYVPHPSTVMFAGHAGRNLVLFANVTVAPLRPPARLVDVSDDAPRFGDEVVVGFNAVVLGPVAIGDRARIGAAAVITRDLAAGSVRRSAHSNVCTH